VKVGFWNVNGWNKNAVSDNFTVRYNSVSYLNLDIIGIAETHLKNCDVLNINGYKWFGNNRQELHKNAKHG